MKRLRRVKAALAAATVTAGVACAMVIPASPAVAFFSGGLFLDIVVESPATLLARGAAVDIPVEYTCNGVSTGVTVQVSQRVGNGGVATGFGSVEVACTGAHQRTTISVPASGTKAFTKGNAFVTGTISGCRSDFRVCGAETDTATVKFRR
jgi:hypothetical protein